MRCILYSCLKTKQTLLNTPEIILPGRTLISYWNQHFVTSTKLMAAFVDRWVDSSASSQKQNALYLPSLAPYSAVSVLFCFFGFFLPVASGPFKWLVWPTDFWTLEPKSQKQAPLSSLPPSSLVSASSAGVCHPLLSPTDMCLPVYCCWPGRLVGVQAGALSLTLWNTTAVRLLPDSMLIVWFNAPMFNHEEKWREREIMIISSKFFCVGSHLHTFRMRCCLQNSK